MIDSCASPLIKIVSTTFCNLFSVEIPTLLYTGTNILPNGFLKPLPCGFRIKLMLSNSQIKLFKSLHNKKFRVAEKQFIIEGHRLIEEALGAKLHLMVFGVRKNMLRKIVNY